MYFELKKEQQNFKYLNISVGALRMNFIFSYRKTKQKYNRYLPTGLLMK